MPELRLFTLMLCCAGLLAAQTTWTSVRIGTDPPGLVFLVDGEEYSSAVSFFWRVGSTHVLAIVPEKDSAAPGARYTFNGWADSTGHQYSSVPAVTVTADPSLWYFVASFSAEYSVELSFFRCADDNPRNCGVLPGTLYIDGTPFWKDVVLWRPAGTQLRIEAAANPGFVFTGWNNRFPDPQSPVQSLVLNASWVLMPLFVGASDVTIDSSPPGLKVMVDGSMVTVPRSFPWAGGTSHALAPVSPQQDERGVYWLFDSWSNGGAEQQVFTVQRIVDPQVVTARYVRGFIVTILTEPLGLKVNVDGSDMWPSPNFVWKPGSAHQVSVAAEQTDKNGRRYAFRGWSDGAEDPARTVTVTEIPPAGGLTLFARYELLGRLTVDSTPPGVSISVDGVECLTPCTIDRPAGARVAIAAPAAVALGQDSRLEFQGWQDQAPRERAVAVTSEVQRITAVYQTMYRVQTASDPAGGARIRLDPAAADGFYAAGTQVMVTAEAQPGFRFRRWSGDLEGTYASGALIVSQPRLVIANLDRVPYVAPAGVVNAAGATPETGVAPGSIISIYGENLAPGEQTGPSNPLAQTLAGVIVQVSNRLLPLFFVSPRQINALLASDLGPGQYKLTIRASGQPDVSASFEVVRNAPGLFANQVDSVACAAATHQDGTQVLPSSPALAGEFITLYGTGFGPYLPAPLDGFLVPPEAVFTLVDPVEIVLGDLTITPQWVRAAAGLTGVTAVRFQVPAALPASGSLPLKVRIDGRESNTVILPVGS
jgi:uncharacterized protein (TIGR03437 family)